MQAKDLIKSKLTYPEKRKFQESIGVNSLTRTKGFKRTKITEYKYVSQWERGEEKMFHAQLNQSKLKTSHWQNWYATAREAAIAVDKKLIEFGMEPVNILKRKT